MPSFRYPSLIPPPGIPQVISELEALETKLERSRAEGAGLRERCVGPVYNRRLLACPFIIVGH